MDPNAAAASAQMIKLPMYDGKQDAFPSWSLKLISLMREKGCHEALLPIPEDANGAKKTAYFKADNCLYNTIITSLSGNAYLFAMQKFSVKEDTSSDAYLGHKLYVAMKEKYAGEITPQEKYMLEMKIFKAKFDRNALSSLQYIQTHRYNFITKTQADEDATEALDNKIVQMILNGLPKSYQTFVGIQRGLAEPPTLEALIKAVEIEERTQVSAGHSSDEAAGLSAAFAAATVSRGRGRGRGRGERGAHVGGDRTSNSKHIKTSVKDCLYLSDFILDSGATQHSTHDITDIDLKSFQSCSEIILSANNSEMPCCGKGDVKIQMGESTLMLRNVNLIPSSQMKLVSLELLLQDKYTITSESPETLVLSQNNRPKLVFQIPKKGPRLYYLVRPVPPDCALSAVAKEKKIVTPEEFAYQHFKLGHLNNQDLASTLRRNGFTISNETMKGFLCEHCLLSKSTTTSVHTTQRTIASSNTVNPGDWIHSDLNGPERSYNSIKYAMDFVDEISGLVSIEFLEHKGQVSKALEQYIRKCRTNSLRLEIGSNTTFHSDGDQVYKSKSIAEVCASERMFQSFSPPYHANLNGAAERTWRTLGNDGRSMMSSAKQIRDTILDDSYWPLAMAHASFLRNLTPRGNRQISAYEKLTGKSPRDLLAIVQPFGTTCFVHDSNPDVQKLDPKAFKCYYVGFDLESNSHKVINPITKMVINTVNVTFDTKPFNTDLLKKSIQQTRPKTVRKYDKSEKPAVSAAPTNLSSGSNDNLPTPCNKAVVDEITSLSPTVTSKELTSTMQAATPDATAQPEPSPTSTPMSPVPQATVEIPRRPSTRSQLRIVTAVNGEYNPLTEPEENIPTVTPTSAKSALSGEHSKEWKASMTREVKTLLENNVFEAATTIPPNTTVMPSMFTFKLKEEPGIDYEKRFKSRLVVLGNHQEPGIHFNPKELSSAVLKASSFRSLTATAVDKGWGMSHMDVNSAFTNTPLEELIYMKLPKELIEMGFPPVVKLLKNLYGFRQAPKGWSDLVTNWLIEDYGFKQSISDACVFTHPSLPIMLGLFVDDSNIIGTPEAKAAFITAFKKQFKTLTKESR